MCACLVNGTLYGLRLGLQDDPFHTELSTIINAIREPNSDARERILSSYDEGVKTYELVRTCDGMLTFPEHGANSLLR